MTEPACWAALLLAKNGFMLGLLLNAEADPTANVYDGKAIWSAHLPQDVVYVVFHGLFGKAELVRHFFIGESALDQPNELLLSAAKPETGFEVQTGESRLMLAYPLEQRAGE